MSHDVKRGGVQPNSVKSMKFMLEMPTPTSGGCGEVCVRRCMHSLVLECFAKRVLYAGPSVTVVRTLKVSLDCSHI